MGNPLVRDYSRTIDIYVLNYSVGAAKQNYGLAIAAGMFKSVVAIILLFTANFIARRLNENTLV
jgi:putative aldouronate transport system permease protein